MDHGNSAGGRTGPTGRPHICPDEPGRAALCALPDQWAQTTFIGACDSACLVFRECAYGFAVLIRNPRAWRMVGERLIDAIARRTVTYISGVQIIFVCGFFTIL